MLARLRLWLAFVLAPALMVAGAANGAYALFDCTMTGLSQGHCCCAAARADEEPSSRDEVSRASCCSERLIEVTAPRGDTGSPVQLAVLPASFVRIPVRALYAFEDARQPFTPREAPRAIGPPLILLYRVLRL